MLPPEDPRSVDGGHRHQLLGLEYVAVLLADEVRDLELTEEALAAAGAPVAAEARQHARLLHRGDVKGLAVEQKVA